jgi:hypothetical protein
MQEIKSVSSTQAMALLQQQQPESYHHLLREAAQKIKLTRHKFNLPATALGNCEAVRKCMTEAVNVGTFALLAAAGLMNQKQRLEAQHEQAELRSLRIQQQLDKLPNVGWNKATVKEIGMYYTLSLAKHQDNICALLPELIKISKLLGTHSTVPVNTPHPHRPHWRDRDNHLPA